MYIEWDNPLWGKSVEFESYDYGGVVKDGKLLHAVLSAGSNLAFFVEAYLLQTKYKVYAVSDAEHKKYLQHLEKCAALYAELTHLQAKAYRQIIQD